MSERSGGSGRGDGDLDVDAAWAQIVAHWERDDSSGDGNDETDTASSGDTTPPGTDTLGPGSEVDPANSGAIPAGPDVDDVDDDADDWGDEAWEPARSHVGGEAVRAAGERPEPVEEGFVPPEPPPLRRGDTISMLAWAGALGGPVFLVLAAILWRDAPSLLIGAAVLGFVAGFVALVVRLPAERADDGDDGAVV